MLHTSDWLDMDQQLSAEQTYRKTIHGARSCIGDGARSLNVRLEARVLPLCNHGPLKMNLPTVVISIGSWGEGSAESQMISL